MIETLYAKNYKAFDTLKLDITNVNILLGSNSSGKSSIINLLLLLSQTVDSLSVYDTVLRLNGSKASLGEAVNIFQDKDKNKLVTIGWSVSDEIIGNECDYIKPFDFFDQIDDYNRFVAMATRRNLKTFGDNDERELAKSLSRNLDLYGDFLYNGEHYNSFKEYSKEEIDEIKHKISKNINSIKRIYNRYKTGLFDKRVKPISTKRLNELMDVLVLSSDYKPKTIEYTVGFNKVNEECELKSISILNSQGENILKVEVSSSRKLLVVSDIFEQSVLNSSRLDIVKGININSIGLLSSDRFSVNNKNPLANFIRWYLSSTINLFLSNLEDRKINHVSPLRAFPQRYYLLEKSAQHNILDSNDGSQLAEILKNNPSILKKVNELFLPFDLKISTAKTNDIIYTIAVKQNNITVELTDVGFGISQVLPIIVQALLCPPDSITVIEQPEIHLHPKMQAWLTTALVNISIKDNKKFIIETHSETIIKRLQILLLESGNSFNGNNLNIFHLERNSDGKTEVKNVPFNDLGEISWPKGFMDLEIEETINLQKLKIEKIEKLKGESNV